MQDPGDKILRKVWVKDDPQQDSSNRKRLKTKAEKMNEGDLVAVYVKGQKPYGIQYVGEIDSLGDFSVDVVDDRGIRWLTAAHLKKKLAVDGMVCSLQALADILEPNIIHTNNSILVVRRMCGGSVGHLTHKQMKAIWPQVTL
jgi:hypothetical protein